MLQTFCLKASDNSVLAPFSFSGERAAAGVGGISGDSKMDLMESLELEVENDDSLVLSICGGLAAVTSLASCALRCEGSGDSGLVTLFPPRSPTTALVLE